MICDYSTHSIEAHDALRVLFQHRQVARHWAGKLAEACGWPRAVRRFKPGGWAQRRQE